LAWLHERGRLKTGDSPVGLRPGEAGACILLESDAAARRRGAEILAYVAGTAQGEERASLFSGEVNLGAALGAAIASVWPEPAEAELDLLADLNGEEWRARELAGARARLGARLARAHLILPAMSLGETGAASGAVGVCLAVRAFVRGYHHGGQALVTSSAEHGHVAAIRLARS
jgi:3-oxoacyl-[acyl-carrier-protein] synthase-1